MAFEGWKYAIFKNCFGLDSEKKYFFPLWGGGEDTYSKVKIQLFNPSLISFNGLKVILGWHTTVKNIFYAKRFWFLYFTGCCEIILSFIILSSFRLWMNGWWVEEGLSVNGESNVWWLAYCTPLWTVFSGSSGLQSQV